MGDEREIAKQNSTVVSAVDEIAAGPIDTSDSQPNKPRFRETMSAADVLRGELQQQQHLQKMKTKERGWFGIVFGTESLASIVIAAFVILLSFVTAVGFEIIGAKTHKEEFWSHEAQTVWAIVTAALGFIFGRSNAPK